MSRTVDLSTTIAAPAAAVWKALTEAEELRRWFPVDAAVEPGAGGSIWLSWGPECEGTGRVTVWEPEQRLQWVEEHGGGDGAVRIAVDYFIEARGGTTVVRLVQSGFGAGSEWDRQVDATTGGWRYFLFNLQHYLERHPGKPRALAWERRPMAAEQGVVWGALTGSRGFGLADGELRLPLGRATVTGRVVLVRPPMHLAGVIPGLDDALLFVELEGGGPRWHCGTYLSMYGLSESHVAEVRPALAGYLDRVLGPFM